MKQAGLVAGLFLCPPRPEASDVTASCLQFQRHFEALIRKLQGDLLYAGASERLRDGHQLPLPARRQDNVGTVVFTENDEEIGHYTLIVVETAAPFKR